MTTAADVLAVAARYEGVGEEPGGSNWTRFHPWWPVDPCAWCALWVSYVFAEAGYPLGPYPRGFLWCSDGANWFAAQGRLVPADQARPGSVVFFEWGSTAGGLDHVGICVENTGQDLVCIEGNTGPDDADVVKYHRRGYHEVPSVGLPNFTDPAPGPLPVRRGDTMDVITANRFGVLEAVDLTDAGIVVGCWHDRATGAMTAWAPITPTNSQPFPAQRLDVAQLGDGRLRAYISGPPFGQIWASEQHPDHPGWGGWAPI